MFKRKEFDLLITSFRMSGMYGLQIVEKIKGINGRVPVVLITGWK